METKKTASVFEQAQVVATGGGGDGGGAAAGGAASTHLKEALLVGGDRNVVCHDSRHPAVALWRRPSRHELEHHVLFVLRYIMRDTASHQEQESRGKG